MAFWGQHGHAGGAAEGKLDIKLREQMPSGNTRAAICLRVFPPKVDCLQKLTNMLDITAFGHNRVLLAAAIIDIANPQDGAIGIGSGDGRNSRLMSHQNLGLEMA